MLLGKRLQRLVDDVDIRNSSARITSDGRISFDGDTSQQSAVNLFRKVTKRGVSRFGTLNLQTIDTPGKLELHR